MSGARWYNGRRFTADAMATAERGTDAWLAAGSSGQDETPLHGALAYCNARQVTDAPNAEFWRRLAGSLRKALTMI